MLNIQLIWKPLEDRKQVFAHSLFRGVFAMAGWSYVACEKISQNNIELLFSHLDSAKADSLLLWQMRTLNLNQTS